VGPGCGTHWKMEWQMLKRLHRKKVLSGVSSSSSVASPLRPEMERKGILLWRQKQMHPPCMI
jgi:hypothetical protein